MKRERERERKSCERMQSENVCRLLIAAIIITIFTSKPILLSSMLMLLQLLLRQRQIEDENDVNFWCHLTKKQEQINK